MTANTPIEALPLLRVLHLASPSLPVGAFTYSQGLEWAVEAGWVKTEDEMEAWLKSLLADTLPGTDIALLGRMHRACDAGDANALARHCDTLCALRETAELRLEESHRGRAMSRLLADLGLPISAAWQKTLARTQLAGFAMAATHWHIPLETAANAWTWSWLENLALAAVKIIPLGQTAGQRVLHRLAPAIPPAVQQGLQLPEEAIGASAPAQAIASSRHETQYTRLFRS
jgi:urease accessory protein